jgi:mannose-6-phosphate isomerase-like protein (cupin superfamily)
MEIREEVSGVFVKKAESSVVERLWGRFVCIEKGDGYQVKRLTLKPGKKISLQKHLHRSEHWVVVSGVAKVRLGDEEIVLRKNESTYVPVGEIHQLENIGKIPLEIIEIQNGEYLEEDDIERLSPRDDSGEPEDNFGRVSFGNEEYCVGEEC